MAQFSDSSANQTDYPISLTWLGLTRGTGKDTFPRVPSGGFESTTFADLEFWHLRGSWLKIENEQKWIAFAQSALKFD